MQTHYPNTCLYNYNDKHMQVNHNIIDKQILHILQHPQQHIGDVQPTEKIKWVVNQHQQIVQEKIVEVFAISKLFQAVLIHVATQCPSNEINKLNITITENGMISIVSNNPSDNTYQALLDKYSHIPPTGPPPPLLLSNIFSSHFTIQLTSNNKTIKLDWQDNMRKFTQSKLINILLYTQLKISFIFDLTHFSLQSFPIGMIAYLKRKVYDLSSLSTNLQIILNEYPIKPTQFSTHIQHYQPSTQSYHQYSPNWKVVISKSSGKFQHISWINYTETQQGGCHVETVINHIVKRVMLFCSRGYPGLFNLIKNHFRLFVQCIVDKQTEQINQFTYRVITQTMLPIYAASPKFIKQLVLSNICQNIKFPRMESSESLDFTSNSQIGSNFSFESLLHRSPNTQSKMLNYPRLHDAYSVGISSKCTLIIIQGQHNHIPTLQYLQKLRQYYGLYILKQKLINTRNLTPTQIKDNTQLTLLNKIIGLNLGNTYNTLTSRNTLRYQSILVVINRNYDGYQFKGLIFNYFQHCWPGLCKQNGFLRQLYNDQTVSNMFQDIVQRQTDVTCEHKKDLEAIDLIYGKKNVEARRKLLLDYDPKLYEMVQIGNKMTFEQMVYKELLLCAHAECLKWVPSLADGLKPKQRIILQATFLISKVTPIASLIGLILQTISNEYSETTLQSSIISACQNYIGSNNFNILLPKGHFGTRLLEGKDCAPVHQLSVEPNPLLTYLFKSQDQHILPYEHTYHNNNLMPSYFLPILPLSLINGCEGIIAGWNYEIMPHLLNSVIKTIKSKLQNKKDNLKMGWQGYRGNIIEHTNSYQIKGKYTINHNKIKIIQIPPMKLLQQYRLYLQIHKDDFSSVEESFINDEVNIEIVLTEQLSNTELQKLLNLNMKVPKCTFALLGTDQRIRIFSSLDKILNEFIRIRLQGYMKRKEYMLSKLTYNIIRWSQQLNFIEEILRRSSQINNNLNIIPEDFELTDLDYIKQQSLPKLFSTKTQAPTGYGYEYLKNIPCKQLTKEYMSELQLGIEQAEREIEELKRKSQKQLWLKDIVAFEQQLAIFRSKQQAKLVNNQQSFDHKNQKQKTKTLKRTRQQLKDDQDEPESKNNQEQQLIGQIQNHSQHLQAIDMVTKMNKTGVTGSKKVKMNKTTNLQPEQIHQLPAKLNQKQTKNPISQPKIHYVHPLFAKSELGLTLPVQTQSSFFKQTDQFFACSSQDDEQQQTHHQHQLTLKQQQNQRILKYKKDKKRQKDQRYKKIQKQLQAELQQHAINFPPPPAPQFNIVHVQRKRHSIKYSNKNDQQAINKVIEQIKQKQQQRQLKEKIQQALPHSQKYINLDQ